MEISSANQAYVFLAMVLCGALCTAVFDIFRAIRRYKNSGTGIIVFQDIVFWIIELFIVYMVAFRLNYAGVRAYEIVALVVGSGIYFVTLSDYVIRFFVWVIAWTVRILGFVVAPFSKLFELASDKLSKFIDFVKEKTKAPKRYILRKIDGFVLKIKEKSAFFKTKSGQNSAPNDNKLQN